MQIKEVKSRSDWRDFHKVGHYIYANDPHWIAPLEEDIENVFKPEKNKACKEGIFNIWVLYNNNRPIGRIAAFVDIKKNKLKNTQEGGIGFFECVNNMQAARMLFEVAENFLADNQISRIKAPVNFGERDKFWGLLIKGWKAPLYHENYNPFYYQKFFEELGYTPHEEIFTFGGDVRKVPLEKNHKIADIVRRRYNVQSRNINKKDLRGEADHLAAVYNAAFADKPHFKPLTGARFYQMLKPMVPVMDPNVVSICFHGDQPVGFCALMPDLNRSLKFAKGKLSWWKLPWFFYQLKFRKDHIVKGVAFGIHPDFQSKGVFAEMTDFLAQVKDNANIKKYESLGLATIRGANYPMVKSATSALGGYVEIAHLSLQKQLDGSANDPYEAVNMDEIPLGDVPSESLYPTN